MNEINKICRHTKDNPFHQNRTETHMSERQTFSRNLKIYGAVMFRYIDLKYRYTVSISVGIDRNISFVVGRLRLIYIMLLLVAFAISL